MNPCRSIRVLYHAFDERFSPQSNSGIAVIPFFFIPPHKFFARIALLPRSGGVHFTVKPDGLAAALADSVGLRFGHIKIVFVRFAALPPLDLSTKPPFDF